MGWSHISQTPKRPSSMRRKASAIFRSHSDSPDAIFSAGYGSSAQFYGKAREVLGMSPGQYRRGGAGLELWHAIEPCALGWVMVAATRIGVCAIEFGDRPEVLEETLKSRFPGAAHLGQDPLFTDRVRKTLALIEQPGKHSQLPLDIQGTAFQKEVWDILRQIPPGTSITYSEVARRLGRPRASRAVARACAANCLAVTVPCHRVVRKDGDLGGYRWGLDRKRELLRREAELAGT